MALDLNVTKRQMQFIRSGSFEVLFGGAAGGGKSRGQLVDALLYALKYAGSRQLVVRRTFPDLERSLIREHLTFYPRTLYRYNSTKHYGQFANGSSIEFGYCDHENDVYQYQGAEYDVIRFDELTQFTEWMYLYLLGRIRGTNDFPKQIKSATNPGGVGHAWVKARFIDIGAPDTEHAMPNGTRIFLPSRIDDNVFLMRKDPGYKKRLENLGENERRAYLLGEWDLFEGQFFPEFRRDLHVCRPREIPETWRRYVSIDYGMDMLSAHWYAVDERRDAWVYRELYEGRDNGKGPDGGGWIVSEAARRLREMNGDDRIDLWLAPPDLWNRRQETGRSAADIMQEDGIPLTETNNDRVNGWRMVREYLAPMTGEQGERTSRLHIFDSCVNLIRTLPALQFDEHRPDDAAGEPHEVTHAPDDLRGFCVYWTGAAPGPEIPEDEERPSIDRQTDSLLDFGV